MATSCARDLKRAVHDSYEKNALSSNVKEVYQRLKNLSVPIARLLDMVDIKTGGKVALDLGTGWGVVAIAAERFRNKSFIVGLDFSPACLKLAKDALKEMELRGNIELILADAENLPFKDNTFDIVLSQATLNLVPDKSKTFLELARTAKAESTIALSDSIKKGEIEGESLNLWCQCVTGALTMKQCERMMQSHGLELEKAGDLTEVVKNLVKRGKWDWPEFLEHYLAYFILKARKK